MARADLMFLRYLKELNRRATTIQQEMLRSVQNRELIQLLNIQKSLVYFTTSLKTNQMLLEKYRKTKLIKLDVDDIDWLDDVEIDNRQAIEMADTYRNVLLGVTDAFDSVISNNLNMYMKRLSILNIIMMVPTFITSFFGMNFILPFERTGKWAVWIIVLMCLISIFITHIILGFYERKYPKSQQSQKIVKQKRKERKNAKRMKSIEAALSE